MAILDVILKFHPYESKPCSSLIVCIIQSLNIHKKSNLKRFFIEYVVHIGLRNLITAVLDAIFNNSTF